MRQSIVEAGVRGELEAGEDGAALRGCLDDPAATLARGARLLSGDPGRRRFVLELPTSGGPRILKVSQARRLGDHLRGLGGSSPSRIEDAQQRRAHGLGLAAAESRGFLELRRGPRLVRSLQVQTPLPAALVRLDAHLAQDLAARGEAALDALAAALADMHGKGFFHADLKPFHAYVAPTSGADYRLRWIDLGRVGFRLRRRQRVINLYQALRYCVPPLPAAHARFIDSYVAASGWYAGSAERALRLVQAFLAHKLRTHPIA